ncbi:MAG: SPOR domain-containing protein [Rhodoblastus sp.]
MSAAPERREPINIDEFERRLRGAEPARRVDDPLAELARLVGSQNQQAADPFADMFAAEARHAAAPQAAAPQIEGYAPPPPPSPASPQVAPFPQFHQAPPFSAQPPQESGVPQESGAPQVDPFVDFPDLRPLLRGADHGDLPPLDKASVHHDFALPPRAPEGFPEGFGPSAQYEDWAETPELAPDAAPPEPPRQRSRKPLYAAAAVVAAGFLAIGSTLAWRGGASHSGGVAMIAASPNPTKIQPKETENDKPARESTMLERTPAPPVKKVVTHEEQPMDVATVARTPRVIPLGDSPVSGAETSTGGAASVPAVAPPAPSARAQASRSAFPEPKRVKTVSVRADGSIISDSAAQASAAAKSAAPPPRNATPKSATRANAGTSPAAKPAAKPAPKPAVRVAAIAPRDEDQTAATGANDEENTASRVSSGAYAVQVASAGSDADARRAASRLGAKLSGALGGRRLAVIKASDKLYRVRVTGLSRESAKAMCGKVKAAGGACFVSR